MQLLMARWLAFGAALWCFMTAAVHCMTDREIQNLRRETVELFYHGFDAYIQHAFPEDELKPLTCQPLTRDLHNPGHIDVNDVLGNYSLTLIDSLSTLAILASAEQTDLLGREPLQDFQNGVADLVELYGDGSAGPNGQGSRARGFDLDSKVQVFETVIRGVGGLLSAHLFAIGEIPIRHYEPEADEATGRIRWPNGFQYDGQLLRLATDLSERLLPAFDTPTGLPYPRVNLRHGVPFYLNSPLNSNKPRLPTTEPTFQQEITETCSAGAGSLVLEFTVLSRLTGDDRFEEAAKKAFYAVWDRRSAIGLIGAGIDAETGGWIGPYTGIGAGIDSFFEYAMKSHILLAGDKVMRPGSNDTTDSEDFHSIWIEAHAGIRHHLYRGPLFQHPHYIQGDIFTGATRALWIDSLSAYYPGLLTLSGELEEAISSHMLQAALWTRYSALPERWNTGSGNIDNELRWWGGRPEFIESNWYLFHATKDPWFLHVAEMVIRDINERCKVPCGWAGLEDVRTGELKDRMESFFLGETAKYLYLTFDSSHPLNKWDAPWVFSTEAHPLVIPKRLYRKPREPKPTGPTKNVDETPPQCPVPPRPSSFSISPMVMRADFFHAASLARLPLINRAENGSLSPESSLTDVRIANRVHTSPTDHVFYPWTLPLSYVPDMGISAKMESRITFDLSFPALPHRPASALTLQRNSNGVSVRSVSGLKMGMIRERRSFTSGPPSGIPEKGSGRYEDIYRVYSLLHLMLGRDEQVFITPEAVADLNPVDPYFTRHKDANIIDLIVETKSRLTPKTASLETLTEPTDGASEETQSASWLIKHLTDLLQNQLPFDSRFGTIESGASDDDVLGDGLQVVQAFVAVGAGAGTLPDIADSSVLSDAGSLTWNTIYVTDEACNGTLPLAAAKDHQIIFMKRGGCPFSEKLGNIPSFAPSRKSLQLVVVVSYPEHAELTTPLVEIIQKTPSGVTRPNPIPLVLVEGDDSTYEILKDVTGIGMRRRYTYSTQGIRIENLLVV